MVFFSLVGCGLIAEIDVYKCGMHIFWLKACPYRCMEKTGLWICRCIVILVARGAANMRA